MAGFLTSDQVNYLIWRYFQESGFEDSAYTFQRESKVDRLEEHYKAQVLPGHLVYLIQRGLQYEELRSMIDREGKICKGNKPWVFLPVLPETEDEGVGTENGHAEENGDEDRSTMPSKSPAPSLPGNASKRAGTEEVNGVAKRRRKRAPVAAPDGDVAMGDADPLPDAVEEQGPRVTSSNSVGTQVEKEITITPEDTVVVGKEVRNVSTCAWNPVKPGILATGGRGDSAHIWTFPSDGTDSSQHTCHQLMHDPPEKPSTNSGITALSWSPNGRWLASGSYSGQTRIWSETGVLEHSFLMHFAPIASLRWNPTETMLLALSCDGKVLAWDIAQGQMRQGLDMPPSEQAVSVEWISPTQYMAGGDNGGLHRYDVEAGKLVESRREAHTGPVECLEYDPISSVLASGGRDGVIITWRNLTNATALDAKLVGHTRAIISLAWQPNASPASPTASPMGPTSLSVGSRRLLASASEDTTVMVWDVVLKQCIRTLTMHIDPLESMCFSPSGEYISSGANGCVIVWRHESGAITHIYDRIKSRRKNSAGTSDEIGPVHCISWDATGAKIAVAEGDNKCAIFGLNQKPQADTKLLDAPPTKQEDMQI